MSTLPTALLSVCGAASLSSELEEAAGAASLQMKQAVLVGMLLCIEMKMLPEPQGSNSMTAHVSNRSPGLIIDSIDTMPNVSTFNERNTTCCSLF